MIDDLFAGMDLYDDRREAPAEGALVLHGYGRTEAPAFLAAVGQIAEEAPFRHIVTPAGYRMSVAVTSCGPLGWATDAQGYRYSPVEPESGRPWPPMPKEFSDLARRAAAEAGFSGFAPDTCLINRYAVGSRISLHQDKHEATYDAPIVSLSLGLPAIFLFGGFERSAPATRIILGHGDVMVWGGPSRLRYHAVQPIKPGWHPDTGEFRISLTFRKAGRPRREGVSGA